MTLPLSGEVFIFMNHRRTMVKLLVWDRSGFVLWFERMVFGRKSERFVPAEPVSGQLNIAFDPEQDNVVEQSVRQMIEAHERLAPEKKAPGHNGRVPIPADLPRVEEVIEPEEDVSDMKRIGEDVTEVLEYEAGRVWVRSIVRPRYARAETVQPQ